MVWQVGGGVPRRHCLLELPVSPHTGYTVVVCIVRRLFLPPGRNPRLISSHSPFSPCPVPVGQGSDFFPSGFVYPGHTM